MAPDESYERATHRISTVLGEPVTAVIPAVPASGPNPSASGARVLGTLRDRVARRRSAGSEPDLYLAVTDREIVAFLTNPNRRVQGEIRRWPLDDTDVVVDESGLERRRIVLRQPDGRAVGLDTPIGTELAANLGTFLRAAGARAA